MARLSLFNSKKKRCMIARHTILGNLYSADPMVQMERKNVSGAFSLIVETLFITEPQTFNVIFSYITSLILHTSMYVYKLYKLA